MPTNVLPPSQAPFDALLASPPAPTFYVLFTGADGANGVSWCPDCVAAKPHITSVFASHPDAHLTTIPLPRSEYSGVPSHWARKHPSVKLTGVPTLFKYEVRGGKAARVDALVEGDISTASLNDLLN